MSAAAYREARLRAERLIEGLLESTGGLPPDEPARSLAQRGLELARDVVALHDEIGRREELTCARCGNWHGVCWSAPSEIWNAVMRGGDRGNPDEFGFCCPNCFMQLADERGVGGIWSVATVATGIE